MPRGVSPSDYRFITLLSYLTSLSLLPPSLSLSLLSSLYSFNPTLGSHTIYLRTPSALTSCLASVSPQACPRVGTSLGVGNFEKIV
ncbi:hypothetical protein V8E36_003434 [Tilletia maclaganii]